MKKIVLHLINVERPLDGWGTLESRMSEAGAGDLGASSVSSSSSNGKVEGPDVGLNPLVCATHWPYFFVIFMRLSVWILMVSIEQSLIEGSLSKDSLKCFKILVSSMSQDKALTWWDEWRSFMRPNAIVGKSNFLWTRKESNMKRSNELSSSLWPFLGKITLPMIFRKILHGRVNWLILIFVIFSKSLPVILRQASVGL